ncbi:MAG: pyridoxamine kinase, partial [Lachnospiraceae bacterium]|nr:pyridoxamine kinase [Lachnospiraceae bacterium]
SHHNNQKKIAVIGDFTGFGRCSLTVSLPVISAMGIQCCPVPTSIFSNHTAYPSYFFDDYTEKMEAYLAEWKKLGLTFSGICTGFLGSRQQIAIVARFLQDFRSPDTIVTLDPVLGDDGRPYATCTPDLCRDMRALVPYADLLTPNLTEACILTDTPYRENWHMAEIGEMARKLIARGPSRVVITGIPQGSFLANLCCEAGKETRLLRTRRIGAPRCGTGDLFTSILAADAVNGVPLTDSVRKASVFIGKCIRRSVELDIPLTDGVCFEEFLRDLCPRG